MSTEEINKLLISILREINSNLGWLDDEGFNFDLSTKIDKLEELCQTKCLTMKT